MFAFIVCVLCLSQPLLAVDLNIYRSVTEIRQAQNGAGVYQYLFKNGEYGNIIDGSITWDGTPFRRQEIYNTMDSLKDASVIVKQASACECNTINAKIVDPNSMLLMNVDTGSHFYADSRSIEYVSQRPSNGGTTLTYEFGDADTGFNGTLSYLVRGITWVPTYDLFLTGGDTCQLAAYANIRNNQQQEYTIDNTYLYSGDLQLVNAYSSNVVQPVMMRSMAKSAVADNASGRPIGVGGEERGFYYYVLKTKYSLRPSSSIRLPFIDINAECRFYYKTTANVGTGQYKGVFQRNYDVKSDQFVPAGILTIRDNKVLVGQSSLPDVPENYTQTVTIGQDNDIRYSINGNMTATSDDKAKIVWRTYSLDVTISNYKKKDVKGQLDFYGAIRTTIDQTNCTSAKVNSNLINLPFELKQGASSQCRLTVTLTWG